MTTITAEEARNKFSDIVNRAAYGKEWTIISRHGKNMAAVVSMEDLELLQRILAKLEDEADIKAARDAIEEVHRDGTVAWAKIKAELGL